MQGMNITRSLEKIVGKNDRLRQPNSEVINGDHSYVQRNIHSIFDFYYFHSYITLFWKILYVSNKIRWNTIKRKTIIVLQLAVFNDILFGIGG